MDAGGTYSLLGAFGRGFGWGKNIFRSKIIIKIYPALSLAIGERDGMDASGGHWMTHSNYRTCHHSWLSGRFLTVGLNWWGFLVG